MTRFIHGLLCALALHTAAACAGPSKTLWYDKPAAHWLEALPVGNGRMGAMVFGGITHERIQFNEQTLWTGRNATQRLFGHNIGDGAMGDYQPFGDLFLRWPVDAQSHTAYRRELSLDSAIATTRYQVQGVTYTREVFASHPDGVIVVRLSADKPASLTFDVELRDVQRRQLSPVATTSSSADRQLSFGGRLSAPPEAAPGDLRWNDMSFHAAVRAIPEGGQVRVGPSTLAVVGADAVTLLLAAATDYDRSPRKGFRGGAPAPKVAGALTHAARKGFERLRADHVADHQSLFGRVSLDLGDRARDLLPTDQRLKAYKDGTADPSLEALLFHYGRYLAIASVRPGGLPANLQGLWNDNPAPAWYSGYTHNINVEMNNWLTETTNLPECAQPLFDWVENIELGTKLNPDPRLQSELGWMMYSTHNPLGGNSGWGLHRPGSAWLSQHFWEHYAFGGDKEFLRQRAYPQLRELTRMWNARLIEGPGGRLITPDGWSPEHGPVRDAHGKVTIKEGDRTPHPGVSYDQQIVWDLFGNFLEAAKALGVDDALRARIADRRARLLGPQIGRWGQIQEWMEDVDDPQRDYRHISHLFALHPGRQITPLSTPEWAKAAKVTLDARSSGSVGWSRVAKLAMRARLHDGEAAARQVRATLQHVANDAKESGTYSNLFGAGPPFQMDANFGYTAGVAEMLLQSHEQAEDGSYILHLLPALPPSWTQGSITGLRGRGGFVVDQTWAEGRLVSATLQSQRGEPLVLRYGSSTRRLSIAKGASFEFRPEARP